MIDRINEAIVNFKANLVFTEEEASSAGFYDKIKESIRVLMRKSPEIFWFSNQYRYDEPTHTLHFKYNFSKEKADFYKQQIDNAIQITFQPNRLRNLTQLEKVTYVYKWLVANTTYNNYSSFNQTIFSVLINRNSVCTGYAKTAQYLLRLLGIESRLAFGKFLADENGESRHAWNLVKIDDGWYHVDFCLADPSLKHLLSKGESPKVGDGILWNYFCITTDRIKQNRTIEFEASLPSCTKSLAPSAGIALLGKPSQLTVCCSDSGSSAKVYQSPNDKTSVIKVARNESDMGLIDNEYRCLTTLSECSHIAKLKGRSASGLTLEQLTPLSQLLESHYYHPDEASLLSIFVQLLDGLIECRNHGLTYSDIHYNNIFVDKEGVFKWGDFGIAFDSTKDGSIPDELVAEDGNPKGSPWFMPPETYFDKRYTESSAIYALAMVFYFVLNDMKPAFWTSDVPLEHVLEPRLNGELIPQPKHCAKYAGLWKVLEKCLSFKMDDRPYSFDELKTILVSVHSSLETLPSSDCPSVICNTVQMVRPHCKLTFLPLYPSI